MEKSAIDKSVTNPYARLLKRLRQAEKSKLTKFDTKIKPNSADDFSPEIKENMHICIQKLLSFLHSLDDQQNDSNNFNENTLMNLFSVNNHLSSSIYLPMNIQNLDTIPKPIFESLKTNPKNEEILHSVTDSSEDSNVYFCFHLDSRGNINE